MSVEGSAASVTTEKKDEKKKPQFEKVRLGVWELIYEKRPAFSLPGVPTKKQILQNLSFLPYVWHFLKEIYSLAPWHLAVVLACRAWSSVEGGYATYLNGRIFDAVSSSSICWPRC